MVGKKQSYHLPNSLGKTPALGCKDKTDWGISPL